MGSHLKELWAATQEGSSVDTADFQVTHSSMPHQPCPDTSGHTCFHRVCFHLIPAPTTSAECPELLL